MSIAAMNWARQQKTGSATRKAVLMAIADYADENGLCWPSQKRLADDTEMTDRTVRSALHDLIELGLVTRRTRRNPKSGLREPDKLQLNLSNDHRKQLPRKELPVDDPAENDAKTTGNSFQNHRKMTAESPEGVSDKPFIEPPQEPSLNRSEAIASGGKAAVAELSIVHQTWLEGKMNIVACGKTEKEAGSYIGTLLGLGHLHADVLDASRAAVAAGTGDPLRYMRGVLKNDPAKKRAPPRERSTAATRFRDRMEAKHGASRDRRREDGGGPIIDHESDERPYGALH